MSSERAGRTRSLGHGRRRRRHVQRMVKRGLDVAASLLVLIVGMPLFAVVAALVKLSGPGPVFFVQERAGRGGRPFRIYKFRTMAPRPREPEALVWTAADEAAITPVGCFLRDYGLDELPQAWNILKGEMSIVGPRPPLAAQAERYTHRQAAMFRMRPGVLSLAAVEGRRSLPVRRRIALHVAYVENWSLCLDLSILWRSVFVVLGRQDATETAAG